ncbi:glycosyltransferase family 2 protein [Bacillus sp. FJAT-25509]|uniref:glycosyltransferase family 2 protein n=1 Tax=Bacillus sp. FJAT-25509 TaxID=1712029 RepID=UPI0006F9EF99|nr:glycosyltransferase family 2 protein [Bacillus sp. FJAT-25509]
MAVGIVSFNNLNDFEDGNKLVVLPLVSVIVATYRRDTSLEKALVSLMRQTYEHVEIVVVDDNADGTWNNKVKSIIDNFEPQLNKRIKYIQNKVNKGSAETRNIGIKTASGEYITFLDDDDIYLPNKIKNQVEFMIENETDFSITDLFLYGENGKLLERRNRKYIKKTTKSDLLRYHLMHHMTGTDTMMFKREFIVSIGGFPPINVGDEFYLMQKAIESGGKFGYLSVCDIKAYVHTNTDGLSSGKSKIEGENNLFEYKKQFFSQLTKKDIRYIKMRHFAVLAFAELRRKKYTDFAKYSINAFITSPIYSLKLLLKIG